MLVDSWTRTYFLHTLSGFKFANFSWLNGTTACKQRYS